jgi:hypothetical protein
MVRALEVNFVKASKRGTVSVQWKIFPVESVLMQWFLPLFKHNYKLDQSATSSRGIRGYNSITATLKFT